MSSPTALLLISHSAQLAAGAVEVAEQMAPDVLIRAAGGTEDERIGTSYDLVDQALTALLEAGVAEVVLLTDLGSAALTAESVLELRADDRFHLADAPFVEGAVAAAVAAQGGANGVTVLTAAQQAVGSFAADGGASDRSAARPGEAIAGAVPEGALVRTLVLRNRLGLHARPAAQLARTMSDFDAQVRVNGVDAASVLALMGLGLTGGAEIEVVASGPQAADAMAVLEADVEAGFGEE